LILIYLVMALLLLIQMLVRLALVDALLIVGPAALVCWVLPQTHSWARLWFTTFFGTVFAQFLVVVVLRLCAELAAGMAAQIAAPALETVLPAPARRGDVMGLLLGIAALYLARKVPALMPGRVGAGDGLGLVRFVIYSRVADGLANRVGGRR